MVLILDGGSRQVLTRNQGPRGDGDVSNMAATVGKASGSSMKKPPVEKGSK